MNGVFTELMIKTIAVSLIMCLIEFLVIVIASPMAKPSFVLRFLPEDIKEAAKDHPEPPRWKQRTAHILFALFAASFIGGIVFLGIDGLKSGYGFWQLWLRFLICLYIIKIFDIFVQDQWLVMTSGFYKKLFPETKECEGWKKRGWNNKNQIIRLIFFPFVCMITAGIFMLFRG